MRESKLMFLQYMTGLLIVVFGSLHFLLLSALAPTPVKILYQYSGIAGTHTLVGGTLYYGTVVAIYKSLIWGAVFELLLTFLVYHIFNGFRVVLSEQFSGVTADKVITCSMFIIGLTVFIWGSGTVALMLNGGL